MRKNSGRIAASERKNPFTLAARRTNTIVLREIRSVFHALMSAISVGSGSHRIQGLDNIINDGLDEILVVALTHDADDGLRAGRTDDQAAAATKLFLGAGDGRADAGVLKRLSLLVAHVLEHLRQRLEAMTE